MLQSAVEWLVGMVNLAIPPDLFDFFLTRLPYKKSKDKANQWMWWTTTLTEFRVINKKLYASLG